MNHPLDESRLPDFDGFISRREEGEEIANALVSRLGARYNVTAATQKDLQLVDPLEHDRAAWELVTSCAFTVALIGPSRFDRETDEPCWQEVEVRHAIATARHRQERNEPHAFFVVALVDSGEPHDPREIFALLDAMPGGTSTPPLYREVHDYHVKGRRRRDSITALADDIHNFLEAHGISLVKERPSVAAEPAEVAPQDLTHRLDPEEKAYLNRSLPSWVTGAVDARRPTAPGNGKKRSVFAFDARRFIDLEGRQRSEMADDPDANLTDTSAGTGKSLHLLEWIYDASLNPLLLIGWAGAGKTTSLTTSAAMMASAWGPTFFAQASGVTESDVYRRARKYGARDPVRFPIVIRCTTLAGVLEDEEPRQTLLDDMEALYRLIAVEVRGGSSEQDVARVKVRLAEQPTAIFLDALDEIPEESKVERVVSAVAHLARNSVTRSQIRFVLSSRPEIRVRHKDLIYVGVGSVKARQIKPFFTAYIDSLNLGRGQADDLRRMIFEKYEQIPALQDVLSLPLYLNLFCSLIEKNELEGNSEAQLFRKIIDHFMEDRTVDGPDGRPLPRIHLRSVLRHLAYNAISSKEGKGKIGTRDAAVFVYNALRTEYYYSRAKNEEDITPEYIQRLLRGIIQHTELISESRDCYEFARRRICEYLAGERIDADSLATTTIGSLAHTKIDDFSSSFSICYALRLNRGAYDHAENVPDAFMARAERAANAGEPASLKRAAHWLDAALKSVCGQGLFSGMTEDPPLEFVDKFGLRAIQLFGRIEHALSITARRRALVNILRTGVRKDAESTARTIQDNHLRLLLKDREPWTQAISVPGPDGGATRLRLADMPVLVCDYNHFIEHARDDETLWEHAPEGEHLIVEAREEDSGPWRQQPVDLWRSQRRSPGSPVVSICWYEAVAYALWKTRQLRSEGLLGDDEVVRLPTEREWKAVILTMSGGAAFPWGSDLSPDDPEAGPVANWRGLGLNAPTPPGVFAPYGRIPGLYDFGSNVLCWAIEEGRTGHAQWPPLPDAGRQPAMGASWASPAGDLRTGLKPDMFQPDYRGSRVGFRLVIAPA